VFAPMSEGMYIPERRGRGEGLTSVLVPQFGRNVPYITTFGIYVILTVPASLVDNFGGLMVLRFLLGLFGSPCLANGGANLGVSVSQLEDLTELMFSDRICIPSSTCRTLLRSG
jgi:MFS family permease